VPAAITKPISKAARRGIVVSPDLALWTLARGADDEQPGVERLDTRREARRRLQSAPPTAQADAARHAASCFLDALKVRTRDRQPVEWAKTQANLGQAFTGIAELKASDNISQQLCRAVECFEHALKVFDENRFPSQHAHVRARLEAASSMMNGRGGNLKLADD